MRALRINELFSTSNPVVRAGICAAGHEKAGRGPTRPQRGRQT